MSDLDRDDDRFVPASVAAHLSGVDPRTIHRWAARGQVPVKRLWAAGQEAPIDEIVEAALTFGEPEVLRTASRDEQVVSPTLTSRERQVAACIARGLTSRQIAEELVISERTADTHADHIRAKLGLQSRAQIAIWAIEYGLVANPHR